MTHPKKPGAFLSCLAFADVAAHCRSPKHDAAVIAQIDEGYILSWGQ